MATSTEPLVYGTVPALVPGHDHLVGVAKTGGDFNAAWHVFVELFTPGASITHITTLAQLQAGWASGAVDATTSSEGIDTGITFLCAVVSQGSYERGDAGRIGNATIRATRSREGGRVASPAQHLPGSKPRARMDGLGFARLVPSRE